MPHLPWLPPHFASLLAQVDTGQRNEDGFLSRATALLTIIEGVVSYLEETGKINGDLYQTYLRTAPDYA